MTLTVTPPGTDPRAVLRAKHADAGGTIASRATGGGFEGSGRSALAWLVFGALTACGTSVDVVACVTSAGCPVGATCAAMTNGRS
mgnify:CR=1 FL=1